MIAENPGLSIPSLKSKRLLLRPFSDEDVHALYWLFTDEQVIPQFGYRMQPTMTAAQEVLSRWKEQQQNRTGIRWAICLEGEVIGQAGLKNIRSFHQCAELGYALLPEYWGKGFCTEAVRLVLSHGFDAMRLNRIEAIVFPHNAASEAVLTKLNFECEGLLRSYYKFDDTFYDCRIWSKIGESM